jgi:ATP-dependent Lon protease
VVRKDLTKLIKEGANVPVYVLEYLLGMYCASDDEATIRRADTVKRILAENYVRPDEAEKVKSKIRESGSYKVIDKVTVKLNEKRDAYEALLSNLGVKNAEVPDSYRAPVREAAGGRHLVHRHAGVFLRGEPEGLAVRGDGPQADPDAEHGHGGAVRGPQGVHRGAMDRRAAALDRHGADLLQGTGEVAPAGPHDPAGREQLQPVRAGAARHRQEPHLQGNQPEQHPGVRRPDHGGQPVLQHGARKVGLVGLWDVVAFDEVAGINFKDHDGVQIMKDYMASGSFSRGRESINAYASMVFVGNINQSVESLVKTSHLFAPFPEAMIDSAFFDRFHAYVPGWEIPKMRPEFFTNQYGLIVDYLAEWLREMRKRSFADAIDKWFKLGNNLNQRDTIAVRAPSPAC